MGFLDDSGVARLWEHIVYKLGYKVDKEAGKGLSTNDFTTDEKNKLAGIAKNANNYTLPVASSTLGGVKTTSTVTSTTGLTATPIINGVPYYKDTNTTYNNGTGISISNNTINHSNSITAKTAYGSTATSASANGGSFTVTDIKYDAQGHITGSTDRTINLSQTTYTLSGLGGVPTSRKVNGHALTADISLTASDVGAITGISGADVIDALGYTPVNQANITYPIPMTKGGTGATKLEDVQKNILDGTYPADGTDISKLAPGIYGLPNDSNNVINAPVASWSPLAFVFGHQNNDTAADGSPSGTYFQGYIEWEGELWLRRRKWDGWGEWMKYYSTKNIIYSSTQPSNASTGTIWLKPV